MGFVDFRLGEKVRDRVKVIKLKFNEIFEKFILLIEIFVEFF